MSGSTVRSGAGEVAPPLMIVVYGDGRASVGGVPVTVSGGADLTVVRRAAIGKAVDMAARHGRPLRALALEPDGAAWPLVVHPDGRVEEDDKAVRGTVEPTGVTGAAGNVVPTLNMAAIPPATRGPRTQTIILTAQWPEVVEAPSAPERFQEGLARIAEAGEGGRIEAAMTLARNLEREAVLLFGPEHPHALQAGEVTAHINSLAQDWARAADKYIALAAAWAVVGESRIAQVRRNATNAHYCWRKVDDLHDAVRIGEDMVRIWSKVPGAVAEVRAARRLCDRIRRGPS